MSLPFNYTDGTLCGVVVGGDINDPAPDQSCNMKIFIPGLHGKDVKPEHLAFSTMLKPSTQSSQQSFEGTLDPGSIVFVRKDVGSSQCHIIGTGNEIPNSDARVPGNIDLLTFAKHLLGRDPRQVEIDIRIPPNIKDVVKNGVKIRERQEKGQLHKHQLLNGIPANGAIYPLAGTIIPALKNIPTAIEQFNKIPTADMLSKLPGLAMSLTSLVGQITGQSALLNAVKGAIPKEAFTAFQSMGVLMTSIETSNIGGAFTSGGRVDPTTFVKNAVDLLTQTREVADVVSVFQRLQFDTSLFGQDKLGGIEFEIDTPFGKIKQQMDASGAIKLLAPDAVLKAAEAFTKLASGFSGVNPGENLFGKSAKEMLDMFGRMPPGIQQASIKLSEVLNSSGFAKIGEGVTKATVEGKNPFKEIFKG
jgi:hypothetical protein